MDFAASAGAPVGVARANSLADELDLTQSLPWFGLSPKTEGWRILTRSGQARMRLLGHRGTAVGPPGKNPGHSEISQRGSAADVDFVSP